MWEGKELAELFVLSDCIRKIPYSVGFERIGDYVLIADCVTSNG